MKKIILFIITLFFIPNITIASENDCNKYDKLSKEYAKCTSKMIKKKSLDIKDKTSTKFDEGKKKFKKLNLKKKLLKFRNSKSQKEFLEN